MVVNGSVGDIRMLAGSFGKAESVEPRNTLFSSELGGGALLDRGIRIFHSIPGERAYDA